MSIKHCSLLSLGCIFGCASPTESSLTALLALKIAQRRLRPEVRSNLLSIASARTDATLVPDAWRFVFADQGTNDQCRVVTVAAKASSDHPDTVEAFSSVKLASVSSSLSIPQKALFIDSNKVLEQARGTSKLQGILSAEYQLQPRKVGEAVWSLSCYAEALDPIASFLVGANTGAICLA